MDQKSVDAQKQAAPVKEPSIQQKLDFVKGNIAKNDARWQGAKNLPRNEVEQAAADKVERKLENARDAINFFPKDPDNAAKALKDFEDSAPVFLGAEYFSHLTKSDKKFGGGADDAKASLDGQLKDDVFKNLAAGNTKDAVDGLDSYKRNAGVFYKALDDKLSMKGTEQAIDSISPGTAAQLKRDLDNVFKQVDARNPHAAKKALDDFENKAKAALNIAAMKQELDILTPGAQDKATAESQKRAMEAVKDGDLGKAQEYIRPLEQQVASARAEAERNAEKATDTQRPTAQVSPPAAQRTARGAQADEQRETEPQRPSTADRPQGAERKQDTQRPTAQVSPTATQSTAPQEGTQAEEQRETEPQRPSTADRPQRAEQSQRPAGRPQAEQVEDRTSQLARPTESQTATDDVRGYAERLGAPATRASRSLARQMERIRQSLERVDDIAERGAEGVQRAIQRAGSRLAGRIIRLR